MQVYKRQILSEVLSFVKKQNYGIHSVLQTILHIHTCVQNICDLNYGLYNIRNLIVLLKENT